VRHEAYLSREGTHRDGLFLFDGGMTAGRPISVSVNERAQLAQAFTALREAS
jgi:hypothetical protein